VPLPRAGSMVGEAMSDWVLVVQIGLGVALGEVLKSFVMEALAKGRQRMYAVRNAETFRRFVSGADTPR
jgi:hypothetical protein